MGHHSTNVYKHKIYKGKKILICRHDWTFSSSLMTDWETDRAEITTTQQHLWRCSGQECQGYWQEAGVSLLCAVCHTHSCRHQAVVFESSKRSLLRPIHRMVKISSLFSWSVRAPQNLRFSFGETWSVKMGCAHASKILTNDDIEFIAKNTALSKDQVEVFKRSFIEI